MSLSTWRRTYYKKSAYDVPVDEALNHSIVKWVGLHPRILLKHGIQKMNGFESPASLLVDDEGEVLMVDSTSCALCCRHPGCEGCPLFTRLGRTCDIEYGLWLDTGNIDPMLTALLDAKGPV